jgi:hypothetical protein
MCFAVSAIHLAAKISQLTSFVFLSATNSAMATVMSPSRVFNKPEGNAVFSGVFS